MSILRQLLIVALATLPTSALGAPLGSGALPSKVNLVADPGFERTASASAWSMSGFSVDGQVARAVARSLRRAVGPTTPYEQALQQLPLTSGSAYLVRAWVRTQNLHKVADVPGWDLGASWYVEWWSGPTCLGGYYPRGVIGDSDWTVVEEVLHVPSGLPAGTTFRIGLYTRQGLEGSAWFDDVEVIRSLVEPVGFEGSAAPWKAGGEWSLDATRAYRGQSSLHASRASAGTGCTGAGQIYNPIAAPVSLVSGERYQAIGYVQTAGLAVGLPCRPSTVGASIYFESYDSKSVWVGGSYPKGVTAASSGWTRVTGDYAPATAAAGGTSYLGLYIDLGLTGDAWFDEVVVVPSTVPPLSVAARLPVYRGTIFPDAAGAPVQVAVNVDAAGARLDPAALELTAALKKKDGTVLGQVTVPAPIGSSPSVSLPTTGSAAGDDLTAEIALRVKATGEMVQLERLALHVATAAEAAAVLVRPDARGFLLRKGVPIFPVGFYGGGCDSQSLAKLVGTAADTVILYNFADGAPVAGDRMTRMRACLDLLAAQKLSTLVSVKDVFAYRDCGAIKDSDSCAGLPGCWWNAGLCNKICWNSAGSNPCDPAGDPVALLKQLVAGLADHPAVLGWYVNDEIDPKYRAELEQKHQTLVVADPAHPTLMVHYDTRMMARLRGTADVYGSDWYPVPETVGKVGSPSDPCRATSPLPRAGEVFSELVDVLQGGASPIIVPQLHGLWTYKSTLPCGWAAVSNAEARTAWPAPTEEQATYFAVDGLIRGARGMIFYSLFDVATEDAQFTPARWPWIAKLLSRAKTVGLAAAAGQDLGAVSGAAPLSSRAWRSGGEVFVAVSNSGPGDQPNRTLALPAGAGGPVLELTADDQQVAPAGVTQLTVSLGINRARVFHYPAATPAVDVALKDARVADARAPDRPGDPRGDLRPPAGDAAPPSGKGCGCAAGGDVAPAPLALLLGLLVVIGRRRR